MTKTNNETIRDDYALRRLHFMGSPHVIATALLNGPDGLTLIDPGRPRACRRSRLAWAAMDYRCAMCAGFF